MQRMATPPEIQEVLFSMGSDGAPGHDDFSAHIYKSWQIVGPSVIAVVSSFFTSDKLLSGGNVQNRHIQHIKIVS